MGFALRLSSAFCVFQAEPQETANMVYPAIEKLFSRFGLTSQVFLQMVKGALPPTIAITMYRNLVVAQVYGNFGFLIALASILALPLQPRARFLQNIALATVWSIPNSVANLRIKN
jgi:hypothetical protein